MVGTTEKGAVYSGEFDHEPTPEEIEALKKAADKKADDARKKSGTRPRIR